MGKVPLKKFLRKLFFLNKLLYALSQIPFFLANHSSYFGVWVHWCFSSVYLPGSSSGCWSHPEAQAEEWGKRTPSLHMDMATLMITGVLRRDINREILEIRPPVIARGMHLLQRTMYSQKQPQGCRGSIPGLGMTIVLWVRYVLMAMAWPHLLLVLLSTLLLLLCVSTRMVLFIVWFNHSLWTLEETMFMGIFFPKIFLQGLYCRTVFTTCYCHACIKQYEDCMLVTVFNFILCFSSFSAHCSVR